MDQNIESESEQSTCVLLPVFSAMEQDIFLGILKKTVRRRSRLGEDNLCNAFASGLSATTLSIDFEDMSAKDVSSKSQEIRMSKLLGFWAASKFPLLGKKYFGDSWCMKEKRTITIADQQTMSPDEFDAWIMKEIKLRVIELTVCHSTRAKMKHFVTVPHYVCKDDSVKISKKMKVLDIQDSYIENCWHALKSGKFLSDDNLDVSVIKKIIYCTLLTKM